MGGTIGRQQKPRTPHSTTGMQDRARVQIRGPRSLFTIKRRNNTYVVVVVDLYVDHNASGIIVVSNITSEMTPEKSQK